MSEQSSLKETAHKIATVPKPRFSRKEINEVVKGFIMAWERGDVEVVWPLAKQFHATSKYLPTGREIGLKEAVKLELDNKSEFLELVMIYAGSEKATSIEIRSATYALFYWITRWRAADRIMPNKGGQGRFLQYGIDDKMRDLERRMDINEQLLRQILEQAKLAATKTKRHPKVNTKRKAGKKH